ncbi:MAG: hypothetical protein J7J98_04375 [candidate division Zixibacteria bacterium]|nr:hypothetical protein [candidate division Zixibacteria bacterium]
MSDMQSIRKIRAGIAGLKRGQWFIDYYESGEYSIKLESLLASIERVSVEPRQGVELVAAFIETDSAVLGRADDSNGSIGGVYRMDACDLFLHYATQCDDKAWLCDLLLHLYKHDEYGVRDSLIATSAHFLPEELLRKLVDEFWLMAGKASSEYQKQHWLLGIEMVARQLKDARLFEKAQCASSPQLPTAACFNIAEVYFESGEAGVALTWLEKVSPDETFMVDERDRLLLKIHRDQENIDKAEETAWRIFRRYRHKETLSMLMGVVGEDKREQIVEMEAVEILSSSDLDCSDVDFLFEMKRIDDAEQYVRERQEQLNGDYYPDLLTWAKQFEADEKSLVTILIYRALLDSILRRRKSKNYHHGVRYLRKLDLLATQVNDWKELPDHQEYKSRLLDEHKRKVSFWGRYNK